MPIDLPDHVASGYFLSRYAGLHDCTGTELRRVPLAHDQSQRRFLRGRGSASCSARRPARSGLRDWMAAVPHRAVRPLMTQDRLNILMFPGLDGTGHMFARVLAELPEKFAPRVIEYPADRALGYDELVSYAEALLPRGRRFAMLAESFSGPVVLQIAAKQPPGLVAVVLVASFHRRPISRVLASLLRLVAGVVFSRPPPAFVARHLLAGPDAPRELVAELRKVTSMVDGGVLAARVRATLSVNATDALAGVQVPILYVGGSEDRLLRRGVLRDLCAVQPAAEARLLPAPHLVLQRRPREAAAIITEFLTRVGS